MAKRFKGIKHRLSDKWDASAGPFFDDKANHPFTSMIAQDLFYKGDVSKKQIDAAYDKLVLQGDEEKAIKLKKAYMDGKYDGKFDTKTAITNLTLTAAFAPVVIPAYLIKKAAAFAWNGNELPADKTQENNDPKTPDEVQETEKTNKTAQINNLSTPGAP